MKKRMDCDSVFIRSLYSSLLFTACVLYLLSWTMMCVFCFDRNIEEAAFLLSALHATVGEMHL